MAKLRNQADPAETCFDLIVEEGVFINGVHHTMSEEDVKFVMQVPWVSIASDGSAVNLKEPGKPHPRSYGTNVRVLGKYVREEKVLTLEDAVRKMTSLPAQTLRAERSWTAKRGLLGRRGGFRCEYRVRSGVLRESTAVRQGGSVRTGERRRCN